MLRSCCALAPPAGCQVSQRLAEEAKKRERFEEMKQQLELDQEVRGSGGRKRSALLKATCFKRMKSVHEFTPECQVPFGALGLFQVMNTKVRVG